MPSLLYAISEFVSFKKPAHICGVFPYLLCPIVRCSEYLLKPTPVHVVIMNLHEKNVYIINCGNKKV